MLHESRLLSLQAVARRHELLPHPLLNRRGRRILTIHAIGLGLLTAANLAAGSRLLTGIAPGESFVLDPTSAVALSLSLILLAAGYAGFAVLAVVAYLLRPRGPERIPRRPQAAGPA